VLITNNLDVIITLFFLFEISVRFLADENKKAFFKSGWNVFDTLVVIISLVPVEDSELALLARLVRVFRVLRMVSVIPELRILINSLLKALPQLGYVVLLMFIIFYIYAAMGSYLFESINPTLWGNIAISMLTLFRIMTFEDWTDIQYETMEIYPLSWTFYLSFIFFTAFAFLNMVIGIVVNVMEQEHALAKIAVEGEVPTTRELMQEIRELKALVVGLSSTALNERELN
jgi:voltage-gated sodium channel